MIYNVIFIVQLIYDSKDAGGSFGLISLQLQDEEREQFQRIGVKIPQTKFVFLSLSLTYYAQMFHTHLFIEISMIVVFWIDFSQEL